MMGHHINMVVILVNFLAEMAKIAQYVALGWHYGTHTSEKLR